MGKSKYYHYFVEGQDEEKLLKVLKTDLRYIIPGKVQVFNVIEQKLTKLRLMSLKPDTTVILIFDTDTGKTSTLFENIAFLKKQPYVREVLCIMQVKNLEDELVRSCAVRQIKELTGSRTNAEYKHDMIKDSNFGKKLIKYQFDFQRFWNSVDEEFSAVRNDAAQIKING